MTQALQKQEVKIVWVTPEAENLVAKMARTLKPQTLDEYFKLIVKPLETKEPNMFDNVKASMQGAIDKFSSLWLKPNIFVDNSVESEEIEDYWSFEMYTGKWEDCDGIAYPSQHTIVTESDGSTWMSVLDTILDTMSKHYGYNIKEQVYYSVSFPFNDICEYTEKPSAGYGRNLNDEIFQQLLLAYPEVFENNTENFKITK